MMVQLRIFVADTEFTTQIRSVAALHLLIKNPHAKACGFSNLDLFSLRQTRERSPVHSQPRIRGRERAGCGPEPQPLHRPTRPTEGP